MPHEPRERMSAHMPQTICANCSMEFDSAAPSCPSCKTMPLHQRGKRLVITCLLVTLGASASLSLLFSIFKPITLVIALCAIFVYRGSTEARGGLVMVAGVPSVMLGLVVLRAGGTIGDVMDNVLALVLGVFMAVPVVLLFTAPSANAYFASKRRVASSTEDTLDVGVPASAETEPPHQYSIGWFLAILIIGCGFLVIALANFLQFPF